MTSTQLLKTQEVLWYTDRVQGITKSLFQQEITITLAKSNCIHIDDVCCVSQLTAQ